MRRTLWATVAVMLGIALMTLPIAMAQQGEQEQQVVEGSLKTVDLEENKIVVERGDTSEVTLTLTEDTKVHTSEGEATVAALEGKEGTALTARFVQHEESNVALMIVLATN